MRLLVACNNVGWSGGLLRFDRLAAALQPWGHEVFFVALGDAPSHKRHTFLPVLTYAEAAGERWDGVMVPGAGFPNPTIERLASFCDNRFGVRVQHILNDPQRRVAFRSVNEAFEPHVVIFNNDHWQPGSFTEFEAERFHMLQGAVDLVRFHPTPYRRHPLVAGRWIVGGLANKNPEPLIASLDRLPDGVSLRLYGPDAHHLAERYGDLVGSGRLELVGLLDEPQLSHFYAHVDCVAMTETMAGWANLAAEALACGVPLVCTRHGTTAFARDGETTLIVDPPSPERLATAILRLREDASLCVTLAQVGREAILDFGWETYGQRLLPLIRCTGFKDYTWAPEFGLFGKWPIR